MNITHPAFFSLLASSLSLAAPAAAKTVSRAPRIEAVFVLDTTGSMGGLINAAKEKIWSIASSMAQTDPAPELELGLVAYRDRSDAYVTKHFNLTKDLDGIYEQLMQLQAQGGGDTPESVNQALHEALRQTRWSDDPNVYKVVFLVGDAPPHLDYADDVSYRTSAAWAAERGIVINTIQCGGFVQTTPIWQEIAANARGSYFAVSQAGGAMLASTPYDKDLARLSAELDATRLYYGSAELRDEAAMRMKVSDAIDGKASVSARARRGLFNASAAGKDNFLGSNELLSAIAAERVRLEELAPEELPPELRKLPTEERARFVSHQQQKRARLKAELAALAKKRQAHIEAVLAKNAEAAKHSLSQQVYDAVRTQASRQKIEFNSEMALH